ncbi:RAMP superfamily CRISPR-associated protein [Haliangium ochraceum]|uniref:CRISPR type III-associated protein domain-containing protein n=1 Tax=Haliangium ochraceum (strain DSM 14365 / JCM 11303 / SMP-2) TaxID=502025 RepID=D0LG41_HALO1|nr:RAMP superfamily CRISPR-associated protein [Haliangium ochraceum]ACY18066.1 protein of unknown function DUF324 [Haliangium ochraceum DSM 14365]
MKHFELSLHFPAGGPLIGGHADAIAGAHIGHATDLRGRPTLPSTAIRGALREALEALLRGAGKRACSGGDGHDPEEVAAYLAQATAEAKAKAERGEEANYPTPPPPQPCTLDNGSRCLPCRLFGTQRAGMDSDESAFSALVIEPAQLAGVHVAWQDRPGVAISRERRSALDGQLVFQRTPVADDLRFVARGRLRDPELATYFEAAVRTAMYIGAGRSRGLGRVSMSVTWSDVAESAAPTLGSGDVYVRAVLQTPAALGAAVVERNFLDCRDEIPGSSLRGALGFALAELLDDPKDDAFQHLVAEITDDAATNKGDADDAGGAQFGFLYPVDAEPATKGAAKRDPAIIGPLPITAQACKRERREHGIHDTLIARLALALADSSERACRAESLLASTCANCGSPMRAIRGSRRAHRSVRKRPVTRVALDRSRGSARDEQLFTQMRIESGTCFEGTIRNLPAGTHQRLAEGLGSGTLSVGRGRSYGWGKLELHARPASEALSIEPLRTRGEAFEKALRQALERCDMSAARASRMVPVTLLAPLLPRDGDEDGAAELAEALGGAVCVLRLRRFAREGGWDQRRGVMDMSWAVTAGSVFVFELAEHTSWRDVAARIEALERRGVGKRRHQGFGHVLCFDRFFLDERTSKATKRR